MAIIRNKAIHDTTSRHANPLSMPGIATPLPALTLPAAARDDVLVKCNEPLQ